MSRAAVEANLRSKLARVLNIRAEGLRQETYATLERNQVGSGVWYAGNPRRSSAPGEPPARQTGRLQESIAVTKRASPFDLASEMGPRDQAFRRAFYPAFLEFGTRNMAPRPFMRPSLATFKRKVAAGLPLQVSTL